MKNTPTSTPVPSAQASLVERHASAAGSNLPVGGLIQVSGAWKCTVTMSRFVEMCGQHLSRPEGAFVSHDFVVAMLSSVDAVDAIYMDDSGPAVRFWTVLSEYTKDTRRAVFRKERELRRWFAVHVPGPKIAFHVLSKDHEDHAATLQLVFKRADRPGLFAPS